MRSLIPLLILLLLCGPVSAADENTLGIFYDASASIDEISVNPGSQHTVYLVLLEPVNDSFDGGGLRTVDFVGGFECGILPPAGDYVLAVDFPLPTINIGDASTIQAGYASGLPVSSDGYVTLASLTVLTQGDNPAGYHLSPVGTASVPGYMAYLDFEDPDDGIVTMLPVGGTFTNSVFRFGNWRVDEDATWDEVKSLYRKR